MYKLRISQDKNRQKTHFNFFGREGDEERLRLLSTAL
jgi:hypothetical protein